MKDHLVSLAEYNLWANTKIKSFIESAGEVACVQQQVSSFNSILQTVLHMHHAQTIWLNRLEGESPLSWPPEPFTGTASDAGEQLTGSSRDFISYINSLDPTEFENTLHYKNIKGQDFSNTWFEIITHVMNHGTYHRGQLVTMFRVAGFTHLEPTDLIAWYREPKIA